MEGGRAFLFLRVSLTVTSALNESFSINRSSVPSCNYSMSMFTCFRGRLETSIRMTASMMRWGSSVVHLLVNVLHVVTYILTVQLTTYCHESKLCKSNFDCLFLKGTAHPKMNIMRFQKHSVAKSIGSRPFNERFDYFSNFHEYKS